ncbi:MAG: hypothetical protein IPL78_10530 [Chloroflexi bacterium]|nr:hypothetical protein [Chloroflexota bacterium]
MVAEEQRQWDATADYYRQALQIYIEFNDGHGQARLLGTMGFMTEEQEKWPEAADYLFSRWYLCPI